MDIEFCTLRALFVDKGRKKMLNWSKYLITMIPKRFKPSTKLTNLEILSHKFESQPWIVAILIGIDGGVEVLD